MEGTLNPVIWAELLNTEKSSAYYIYYFVVDSHTAPLGDIEGMIRIVHKLSPKVTRFMFPCEDSILHMYPNKRFNFGFRGYFQFK